MNKLLSTSYPFLRTVLRTQHRRPLRPQLHSHKSIFATQRTTSTMAPIPPIFTLPVATYKSKDYSSTPGGTITLTQPSPKIYLLTMNVGPDNRITPPFLSTIRLALDIILTTLSPGVVVTTSAIPKFFSNGLDYASAINDPTFLTSQLYPLWHRLLTFPWPTVALINGHAFAAGLMTAMAHDYRIMNPNKGFLCLNELDFGAPLTPAMASLFKVKLPMSVFRTLILEAKRFNGPAALEAGIVDGLGAFDDALKMIKDRGIDGKLSEVGKGSYGLIKEEMYKTTIKELAMNYEEEQAWVKEKNAKRDAIMAEGREKVEEWTKGGGKLGDVKSKL